MQSPLGGAGRLPMPSPHGPGRAQQTMGIGKKAGITAEACRQAPGKARPDQGFTGVEGLAAIALAPLGLAPMLE